jgi:tetratricopeptide (TPR) repeat protein
MDSSKTDDLEKALDLLEEAYDLAEEENEKKNVAQKLADTYWNLAKEIDKDSDEWWQHLNQAKTYYTEILPWYDGKQGVAKVSRKQGKYYLNQEEEEAALEMFQNIADLEEEYDVQLLTDADERKLEELS